MKLWCGLAGDSTEVVRAIFELAPVAAFESLADAQKIEPRLAEEMIVHFRQRLGEDGEESDAINRAFAAVAADLRPRGRRVFDFLIESLSTGEGPAIQEAAAAALSRTNLPRAAQALADRSGSLVQARSALVRMGEIAVRELTQKAVRGSIDAVDDLHAIGTPQAALSLVPLLWAQGRRLSTRAAWLLAAQLRSEAVETALRECSLTADERQANGLDWVWEPFEEPESSALPVIAGRIGYLILEEDLIQGESEEVLQVDAIDRRLGLALSVVRAKSDLSVEKLWKWPADLQLDDALLRLFKLLRVDIAMLATKPVDDREQHIRDLLEPLEERLTKWKPQRVEDLGQAVARSSSLLATGQLQRIWQRLDPPSALGFFLKAMKKPSPTVEDWRNIFRPSNFSFIKSWMVIVSISLVVILAFSGFAALWLDNGSLWFRVFSGVLIGLSVFRIIWGIRLQDRVFDSESFWSELLHVTNWPYAISEGWKDRTYKMLFLSMISSPIRGIWIPIGAYYTIKNFSFIAPWIVLAVLWAVFVGTSTGLWMYAQRLQRKAQNTLHGLLALPPRLSRGEVLDIHNKGVF